MMLELLLPPYLSLNKEEARQRERERQKHRRRRKEGEEEARLFYLLLGPLGAEAERLLQEQRRIEK